MGGITGLFGYLGAREQGRAAKDAAKIQAGAADRASEVARELYDQTRSDLGPYRAEGEYALRDLARLAQEYSGGPALSADPSLPQTYTPEPFTTDPYAPDPLTTQPFQPDQLTGQPYSPAGFTGQVDLFRDPSYQFRVNEGLRAIEHRAASRGQLQSGNTLKDLTRFGQEAASQEYGNAFQRGLVTSQQQAQLGQQGYGNQLAANQRQAELGQQGFGNQLAVAQQRAQLGQQGFANQLLTSQQRAQLGQQGYGNQLQANELGFGRTLDLYGLERQRAIEDQRNRFNQFQALANYGAGAAGQQVQANQQLSGSLGDYTLQRGNALSAGRIGAANAYAAGLQAWGQGLQSDANIGLSLFSLGSLRGGR